MKRYSDVISGGVLVLISVVMLFETRNIRALGIMKFGPKIMPRLFSSALLLVGIGIVLYGLKAAHRAPAGAQRSESEELNGRKVAATAGLITFYVFALEPIGFIITTMLYLFLQFLVLGGARRRQLPIYAVLAVAVSLGVYALFYGVFDVFLPPGLLY